MAEQKGAARHALYVGKVKGEGQTFSEPTVAGTP